jgi:hypothetical protein
MSDVFDGVPRDEPDALPAPSDPMGVARVLIDDHKYDGELTLRHWRNGWMQWHGTHWIEAEDKAIRSWLYERLEGAKYWHVQPATQTREEISELRPWNPNRHKVADVLDALAAVAHTGGRDRPAGMASGPQWSAVKTLCISRVRLWLVQTVCSMSAPENSST